MGRGTTPLEAALRGRIAAGADANPLGEMLAAPRLDPPELAAIADWLGRFDWDRPAELQAFYHPETLRNLCLLRDAFIGRPLGKTESWIRLVALSRLAGHSPRYFSVRTLPPNQAVTPSAQRALNARLNQSPPPRDIPALILKKSRSLLRQPPNIDSAISARHRLWTSHAETRSPLAENSVALVVGFGERNGDYRIWGLSHDQNSLRHNLKNQFLPPQTLQ